MNRRQVLATLGVTVGGISGLSTRIHGGPLSTWSPAKGTWPLRRYDLGNTAANPIASPPATPSLEWQSDPIGNVTALVADQSRLYVGSDDESRDRILALDRTTGAPVWSTLASAGELAVHGNRLYAAAHDTVRALDSETGEPLWSKSFPVLDPNLLVADGHLFVAGKRVVALDAATGEQQWEYQGGHGAIADGAVVTWDEHLNLARLDSRRVSDLLTDAPPPVAWAVHLDRSGIPVVSADRIFVGNEYELGKPGLSAVSLDSGEIEWGYEPDSEGDAGIGPPAVTADRGFADYNYQDERAKSYQAVVAVRLKDGARQWEEEMDSEIGSVVVAGETVLVATRTLERDGQVETSRGAIHAFSLSGEKQWQFDVDVGVWNLVAVDDTIYFGTSDIEGPEPGRVYALS